MYLRRPRDSCTLTPITPQLAGKRVELPALPVVSHEEVIAKGKEKADVMKRLVARIVDLTDEQRA